MRPILAPAVRRGVLDERADAVVGGFTLGVIFAVKYYAHDVIFKGQQL